MKELLLGSTPLYDGAAGAANATFAWVKFTSKAREDAHTLRLNDDACATVTRDAAPRARGVDVDTCSDVTTARVFTSVGMASCGGRAQSVFEVV